MTAINHGETLKHYIKTEETVNKVNIHNSGEENKDCIFCTTKHPLKYKFCPAWGKYCNKCGDKNHFEARCDSLKRRNAGQRSKQRMWHMKRTTTQNKTLKINLTMITAQISPEGIKTEGYKTSDEH